MMGKGSGHVKTNLCQDDSKGGQTGGSARRAPKRLLLRFAGLAVLVGLPLCLFAAQRGLALEQFRQMLRRFPDADLNKDGNLTMDEFR